jgi:hypothetical protein
MQGGVSEGSGYQPQQQREGIKSRKSGSFATALQSACGAAARFRLERLMMIEFC